ncbi:hypothetical protein [Algoriphagus ornithinivorans]|nr:hypothetical protein [Algoriphagus ornithinivorans]
MIFSNDFQSIVSLGFNNAGRLLSDEIENLGSDSFQSKENLQNQWFRPSGIRRDSGSGDRFIFNKSTLASVNTIKKRSDNFHIKTALDFSSEDFNNSYQVRKSYFLESGRLDFLESGFFKEKRDHFNLNVNMIKNSSVDFFSNQFGIGIFNTKSISDLVFQSQSLDQRIKSPDFLISNIFKKLIDIKSGIVDINSTSFFMVQSPELLTSPPFLGILQDSSMQSGMSFQKVRYLLYDFNNSLTLKGLRFLNLSSSSAVGIKARNSSLESASFLGDELLGFSFQNNLTLQEVAGLTSVSFEKNTESIKAKVIIPVKYIHYKLRDVFENKVLDEVNQVIIEPEAFLNFDFNPSLSFRNFISRKVSIGSLYDLYPGQIFVNYQTVQVKDAPVPLIKSNKLSFSQNFKDPLYSLFLNSSISLGLNSRNTLMKSEVEDSGLVRLRAIARDNIEKSFSWNGDGSKYFPTVRTTMAIGSSYNWIFREFAINESFQFLNYYRWNGFLKAVYRKVGKVNFELKYDYSSIRSIAEESFDNSLFLSSPSISIFVFPDDNQNLKLTFEALAINSISGSSNTSVSFLDFAYNYKVPEKKIEFSVIGANLLGQNRLTSVSNSSFIFIEESRVLRPRQVTFRIEYSF